MSDKHSSESIDRVKAGSKFWEGGIGRSRFRALWDRGPGHAQFQFQGPFTPNDDPDGIGVPFSSGFGIAWEKERGARIYGERWNNLREWTNRSVYQAAELTQRSAERMLNIIPGNRWKTVGRQDQSTNKSESKAIKHEQGLKAQRISIEYDKTYDPFDDGSAIDSMDTALRKPVLKDERDARRRAILEAFRAGTISLEEAELRLNNLN